MEHFGHDSRKLGVGAGRRGLRDEMFEGFRGAKSRFHIMVWNLEQRLRYIESRDSRASQAWHVGTVDLGGWWVHVFVTCSISTVE